MPGNPGAVQGNIQIAAPQVHTLGPQAQNDATATNPVGGKMRWNNQTWRYVKLKANTVAPTAGGPAYACTSLVPAGTSSSVPLFTVSADRLDSLMLLQVVGVFGAFTTTPTDGNYIWVQIGGVHPSVVASGSIVGSVLIGSSTSGQFGIIADGSNLTNIPCGRVCGTSSGGTAPALLMNMDW